MAGAARNQAERGRWLIGAGWMAGISIGLVEMQMGVDYVQASVVEHAKMIAGWLPMIGTLVCRYTGSFVPAPFDAGTVVRLCWLSAIPVAVVTLGWLAKSRAAHKRKRSESEDVRSLRARVNWSME